MGIKCPKCHFDNPADTLYCGKCATPLPSSKEIPVTETLETPVEGLKRGTTFAERYEIIEGLGTGGMGKVYRVKDKKLDEEMALKILKPEIAADKGMIERFKNELKLSRKIAHRSVCKMYDLNEEEGTHFITMEYVTGEDLKSYIRKKGKISEEDAISIAKQICEGLSEAHELGVVHRDLKPQNIMIDEKGRTKIMDFGIARSVEAPGMTQTGIMIGTPDYISPEQAEGEEADQRSDIYALGVILYEMVTGSVPFKGDTALSVALKHKSKIPPDPKKLNPEVSEDLSRLILICMEKDRERRYQKAEELLADLRNREEGFPLGTKIRPRRETFVAALIRKKLFTPALVVALAIIGVIIWQLLPQKEAISPGKPSVAVLPFIDLSPQKDQEYLCEGMADSIINALSKIKDIRVPAITSSSFFKGKERDLKEIGKRLNVKTVLQGKLQRADNRLRITSQLINIADESIIWSEQYNRELDDVFAIQDEISLAVVDKLKIKLLGEEKARVVKRYTEDPEAYNLYLKGIYFMRTFTPEGYKRAIECFQQALQKDPNYALAYSGLAMNDFLITFIGVVRPKEAVPRMKANLKKALEIDPNLGEAHAVLGSIYANYDWDWQSAEQEFKQAVQLNPNSAHIHYMNAHSLAINGRHEEAVAEAKRAQKLDPINPLMNGYVGVAYFYGGQYDNAIEVLQMTQTLSPNWWFSHYWLGFAYQGKSMLDKAIAEYEKAVELMGGSPWMVMNLTVAYYQIGKKAQADKLLESLKQRSKQEYIFPMAFCWIHLVRGDLDQAYEWLERACEEHDNFLICIVNGPPEIAAVKIFDEPRFKELLKKYGVVE